MSLMLINNGAETNSLHAMALEWEDLTTGTFFFPLFVLLFTVM
jgi:hypothetical protein